MSAYIVEKEHIDYLVKAIIKYGLRTDANQVGKMLWTENIKSVNYRYSETTPPYEYKYSEAPEIEPVQLIKSIHCYEYQSCEHPSWEDSESRWLMKLLMNNSIIDLPGYCEAKWGAPTPTPRYKCVADIDLACLRIVSP